VISLKKGLTDYFTTVKKKKKHCESCNKKTSHKLSEKVSILPPILTIRLDRFQKWENGGLRKVNTFVDFAINNLNLRDFLSDSDFQDSIKCTTYYDLFAVISHHGTTIKYGHYILDVKNPLSKTWIRYDDHVRTEINKY